MGGFRFTGLGAGSANGHSLRYEQLFTTSAVTLLGALDMVKGADIASAGTLNLTTATGNGVHVTGTTTITAVTLGSGMWRLVVFDGALTLTHHATNNNLPGGANITTAAGDRALYWADGTTVYCAIYMKANGKPIAGASGAITSSDFTMSTARILLRTTAGTGAIEEGSVAGTLSMTGGVLTGKVRLPIRTSGATETLVAADMGKLVVTSTASTLTLPLLSAVTDGDIIGFQLNGVADVTVQRQGTNELSWGTIANLVSVKLTQYGDYLFLVADTAGGGRWRVLSDGIMGPSFQAQYEGAGQSIGTGTATKLQFNTEISDSHGYYDPTTNFRFTPLIPGWYMVSCSAYISGAAASRAAVILYKNGAIYTYGQRSYTTNDGVYTVSAPVFFNGTTDFVEAYGITVDAAGTFDDTVESNFFAMRIR